MRLHEEVVVYIYMQSIESDERFAFEKKILLFIFKD